MGYLQLRGLDPETFLHLAVEVLEGEETEEVLEGLVASESYPTFFEYMSAVRRRREWAERSICGSSDEIDWTQLVRWALRRDLGDVTGGMTRMWSPSCEQRAVDRSTAET